MDIYHHFLQLLSFVRHSNDNIDKNARFVSALFKLDFDAYRYKILVVIRELNQKQNPTIPNSNDEADDDDEDQEMKDSTQRTTLWFD